VAQLCFFAYLFVWSFLDGANQCIGILSFFFLWFDW
jgi:hypothetical protein